MDKKNIEKFYDYFDIISNQLYEKYQKTYLEGMNEAFNFLFDDQLEGDFHYDDIALLKDEKKKIVDISFTPEEIRKGVQLGLLKGYKHAYASNSLITPDTIGIFIAYLVKKLYKNKEITNLLDPLVGTGNLVYSIINHLEKNIKVYGVDNDLLKCNLARNLGDLTDTQNEIFFQDTLSYFDQGFDLIVTDMPYLNDESNYLPYQVINHHLDGLAEGGFFVSIIDNDFFEKKGKDIFKAEIDKKGYIYGLIKLSETLFKTNPKSILIIQKKGAGIIQPKDFLLVELPSFNEVETFNDIINQIDMWFLKREEELIWK